MTVDGSIFLTTFKSLVGLRIEFHRELRDESMHSNVRVLKKQHVHKQSLACINLDLAHSKKRLYINKTVVLIAMFWTSIMQL